MSYKIKDLSNIELPVLYSDDTIAVVDKMADFLSVPGKGDDKQDCAENRIRQRFPNASGPLTAHRLDMATSGLLVFGLTPEAQRNLSIQFQNRGVDKRYIAVLEGIPADDSGIIELPFRVDLDNRPYQILDPVHGKVGITHWRKLAIEDSWCRIEFKPLTGRTHQLRVHSAHQQGLGFPIVGDNLYGNPKLADRLLLHAAELSFEHPENNEQLTFKSEAPF